MADARLVWTNSPLGGHADLVLLPNGSIEADQDLATAVIVSLFTDRLAADSDPLPPGDDDRRGWCGDTFLQLDNPGDLIGSRLWLLERHTSDDRLPLTARGYILEALQWLIADGVAAAVDADCFFIHNDQSKLGAVVTITRSLGAQPVSLEFNWAWQSIGS